MGFVDPDDENAVPMLVAPAGAGEGGAAEKSHGPARGGARRRDGGDPQLVFTNVLLSVVGAYGVTGSAMMTVVAAVIALLVTVLVARRR